MTMTSTAKAPEATVLSARRREPGRPSRFRPGAGKQLQGGPFAYIALAVVGIGSLLPLYWTLVAASHTQDEVLATTPPFLPGGRLPHNLDAAWNQAHLGKAIVNSFVVAGCITAATLFFCTLAGYAFAKMRFRAAAR